MKKESIMKRRVFKNTFSKRKKIKKNILQKSARARHLFWFETSKQSEIF